MYNASMTSRDRLLSQLRGEKIDRIPVYTQAPFTVDEKGMKPGPFHGYADYDSWREADPAYSKLVSDMEQYCDNPFIWRPPCMQNLQFMVSSTEISRRPPQVRGERVRFETDVQVGGKMLREIHEVKPGTGHSWQLEHLCKSAEDARSLIRDDWIGEEAEAGDFGYWETLLGDRGVMWVTIPSPLMVVCRLFDPMAFLLHVRTESELVDELMSIAQKRIHRNLRALLAAGVGPVVRFGGAEHATPPMMSPDDFDHLVVEYDTPLVDLCKEKGRYVAYHCHGHIRHALKRFREMGVRMTDPVETDPDGDLTISEARRIAGDDVILAGNVQCRELFSDAVDSETIRNRVRRFIDQAGPDNIIITTTGAPLEPISLETAAKYHAFIEEALA
jgi:hypothetical protein